MVKKLILSACLFTISLFAHAQFYTKNQADSLKTILNTAKETALVDNLLHLTNCYSYLQLDSAKHYVNRAEQTAMKLDYNWGIYKSKYFKARILYHNTKLSEVKHLLEESTIWFEQNGYTKDALMAELYHASCSEEDSPLQPIEKWVDTLLMKAQALGDKRILSQAWYKYHIIRARQLKGPHYQASLDSAIYYAEAVGDPFIEDQLKQRKIMYQLGRAKSFETLHKSLIMADEWGNVSLLYGINRLLLLNHAVRRNNDSLEFYFDKSMEYAMQYGSKINVASVDFFYATVQNRNFHNSFGLPNVEKSERVFKEMGHMASHTHSLKTLGQLRRQRHEYLPSIEYYLQASKQAKQLNNIVDISFISATLADLYALTKEYEKAEKIYFELIDFSRNNLKGNMEEKLTGRMYTSLALIYREQGRIEDALSNLDTAITKHSAHHFLYMMEAHMYQMSIHLDLNHLDIANEKDQLITAAYKDYNHPLPSYFFLQRARLKHAEHNYAAAIKEYNRFLALDKRAEYNLEKKAAFKGLYTIYKDKGNYRKALDYHERYKTMSDSVANQSTIDNLALIQSQHEVAEREADIVKMKQEQELQQLHLDKKNNELALGRLYITLLIISLMFVGIASYWIYHRYRLKKEAQMMAQQLASEQERVESQSKLELAKAKNDLFANVSHEFRTPLTLIQVPIKNYLNKAALEDKAMFNSVLYNTEHLLQMIDEMLDLSRMESGSIKLHPTPIDLLQFCTQMTANFNPLFKSKDLRFSIHKATNVHSIYADRNRLNMVFNNLLKNAFHHSPIGGAINLELKADQQNGQKGIQIYISNTGQGITEHEAEHIFDRFYRSNEENYNGYGIGLAICKQIVELHRGNIGIDTQQINRTTFHFFIPTEFAALKTTDLPPMANHASTNTSAQTKADSATKAEINMPLPKLLIVEDNPEMRNLLESILTSDFDLMMAQDGVQGEELAQQYQPDIILSDVMMPNKDGFELLKAIKTNLDTSHIPIVLLTAKVDLASRIQGFDQDADDYISKPFDPNELKARIYNLLRQRKQLKELFSHNPLKLNTPKNCSTLDSDFLKRARSIVENEYMNGDFTVEQFCQKLALNRMSVHNKLKALIDQSASQYIQSIRLAKAAELLLNTAQGINEVAIDSGFNTRQAFNKAFKNKYKLTPTEYRNERNVDLALS